MARTNGEAGLCLACLRNKQCGLRLSEQEEMRLESKVGSGLTGSVGHPKPLAFT